MLALLLLAGVGLGGSASPAHPDSMSLLEFEASADGLQLNWWIQSRTLMEEPEVGFEGADLWAIQEAEMIQYWPGLGPYLEAGFTIEVDGQLWQPRFPEYTLEENGATVHVSARLELPARPRELRLRMDHFFDGGNPAHTVHLRVVGFAEEPELWWLRWGRREAVFPIPRDPNAPPPPSAFSSFFARGRDHVLGGLDHVAFLAALLFGVLGWRSLLAAITAFTVSHSITLALGALDWLRLPPAWVEPGIAFSISAALWWHVARGPAAAHAWRLAFVFGLLHGSSFATQLRDLGEREVVEKLLGFNLGVEFGQLLFVLPVVLMLRAVRRLLGTEREAAGRQTAALLLGALALVQFGRALEAYTVVRLRALPEGFAPAPGTLLLGAALVLWAWPRRDPRGQRLAPQIGGSLGLGLLYLTGTWLGS